MLEGIIAEIVSLPGDGIYCGPIDGRDRQCQMNDAVLACDDHNRTIKYREKLRIQAFNTQAFHPILTTWNDLIGRW